MLASTGDAECTSTHDLVRRIATMPELLSNYIAGKIIPCLEQDVSVLASYKLIRKLSRDLELHPVLRTPEDENLVANAFRTIGRMLPNIRHQVNYRLTLNSDEFRNILGGYSLLTLRWRDRKEWEGTRGFGPEANVQSPDFGCWMPEGLGGKRDSFELVEHTQTLLEQPGQAFVKIHEPGALNLRLETFDTEWDLCRHNRLLDAHALMTPVVGTPAMGTPEWDPQYPVYFYGDRYP